MQTQTSPAALWDAVRARVQDEVRYAPLTPWIERISCNGMEDSRLSLTFSSPDLHHLFSDNLHALLEQALSEIAGGEVSIELSPSEEATASQPRAAANPEHTFLSFVRGGPNRLAAAATEAVAREPGTAYNPLLLYGGSGLGKTHLLHALALRLQAERPSWSTGYFSFEAFRDCLLESGSPGVEASLPGFDVLIVDDIHRIADIPEMQERLIVLFNQLLESRTQMAFASLPRPSEMEGVAESLLSRLQWGLAVELEPLTEDLRYRMLRIFVDAGEQSLPEEVLRHVAAQPIANPRDLQGLLHHLESHARLLGQQVDLETARSICRAHLRSTPLPAITLDHIERFVCEHFALRAKDLRSRSRTRAISYPRQVAMFLAHTLTASSLEDIGRHFGGRDHSTVKHGCDKIRRLSESDAALRDLPDLLRKHVSQAPSPLS